MKPRKLALAALLVGVVVAGGGTAKAGGDTMCFATPDRGQVCGGAGADAKSVQVYGGAGGYSPTVGADGGFTFGAGPGGVQLGGGGNTKPASGGTNLGTGPGGIIIIGGFDTRYVDGDWSGSAMPGSVTPCSPTHYCPPPSHGWDLGLETPVGRFGTRGGGAHGLCGVCYEEAHVGAGPAGEFGGRLCYSLAHDPPLYLC